MATNKYIGMRYVPKIMRDDEPWDTTKEYESLTVVQHQGNSFTSRKNVPAGIDILNKEYWACTGNYNSQVELYRQETQNAVQVVNNKLDSFTNLQDGKFEQLLLKYKGEINSYADGKYNDIDNDIKQLNENISNSEISLNQKINKCENNLQNIVNDYTSTINNQINRVENVITSIDIEYDEGLSTDVEDEENITEIDGNGGIK